MLRWALRGQHLRWDLGINPDDGRNPVTHNDVRLNKGLPPLGYVVPRIWDVAERFPGEAFIDLATAANTSCGCGTYFPAAKGWDPQTGWGYPHWPGLLAHLGKD